MELLALLSKRDGEIISDIKAVLREYTVYPLRTVGELEDLYANIPLSLVIIDTLSYKLSSISKLLHKFEDNMVILITTENLDRHTIVELPKSVYTWVDSSSIKNTLPPIVERAIERQRLKNEIVLLKKSQKSSEIKDGGYLSRGVRLIQDTTTASSNIYLWEKTLINFARMLNVNFDMKKLFNFFMDSIMGITRVNKMSVMLKDEEEFSIISQYGLDPHLTESIKLRKDGSLPIWLTRTGRIIHKPDSSTDTASVKIKSEMELLQCSFSFPMLHKGKLIGIFNIGDKITGEPFYKEELEIIYMFCNYLAAAVKDIDLYHQIWYQKEFTKNILSSMHSGVIAIDKDAKVTIFNQKASEILKLDPLKITGGDLKVLPSPLGDILYETMISGISYNRYETQVSNDNIPVGINSCRLLDKNQNPMGASIIFSDLSDSKRLEEEKKRAEKLEIINNLVAKIAHEVRTPLTSIKTYIQILSEKYKDDEDLYNFFMATVLQSIHKLDTLIDQLVIFSNKSDYNLNKEEASLVINEAVDYILKNMPRGYKLLNQGFEGFVQINVDKRLFIRAIFYLILYIIDRVNKGTLITINGRAVMQAPSYIEILIRYNGESKTAWESQDLLKPLSDINNLGTELNVPISKKIIEGHNGSIVTKSEDNTNIFVIRLPAAGTGSMSMVNAVIPI